MDFKSEKVFKNVDILYSLTFLIRN